MRTFALPRSTETLADEGAMLSVADWQLACHYAAAFHARGDGRRAEHINRRFWEMSLCNT